VHSYNKMKNERYLLIYSEAPLPFEHICDDYYYATSDQINNNHIPACAHFMGDVTMAEVQRLRTFDKEHDTLEIGVLYRDAFSIFEPDEIELESKTRTEYVFMSKDKKYLIKVAKNKCKVLPLHNLKPSKR
jgi:hypothetical protein